MEQFKDRHDAGRKLAERLDHLDGEVVVLGMARGGVPVAWEVAKELDVPLDVLVVRKLGVPFQPELAMGALGEGGVSVVDESIVAAAGVTPEEFASVQRIESSQLDERIRRYRGGRPLTPLKGKTVVVVDDGIATGSSARAACSVVRAHGAKRVILATPVIAPQSIDDLKMQVDALIWVEAPTPFYGVGQWYQDFSQTSDEEVIDCLNSASEPDRRGRTLTPVTEWSDPTDRNEEVSIDIADLTLLGHLTVPDPAGGIVIFVHGSGSSRHSPRNRAVASSLNERGLGTLLFDLLTPSEELDRSNVFDIDLLASRLLAVTLWLRTEYPDLHVRFGYFGASTGAGAALVAAAHPMADVAAVVSRGGRVDLAGEHLASVRAPTLLIVGGDDQLVLELNRRAQEALTCDNQLEIVQGASHLFEEPGALNRVAMLAGKWFESRLLSVG